MCYNKYVIYEYIKGLDQVYCNTKENYLVDAEFNITYMGTYNYYGPSQPDKHKKYNMDLYLYYVNER